jgi:hypothetical protein
MEVGRVHSIPAEVANADLQGVGVAPRTHAVLVTLVMDAHILSAKEDGTMNTITVDTVNFQASFLEWPIAHGLKY